MHMRTPHCQTRVSRRLIRPAIFALILMPLVFVGCSSSDGGSEADSLGLTAATNVTETFVEPLTIDDVTSQIELTTERQSQMAAALERFNQAVEQHRLARENREPGQPPAQRPEPPGRAFLVESAEFLDTEQLVGLVQLMAERHEAARQQRQDQGRQFGRGMRDDGPRGGGFVERWGEELNLTGEQKEKLEALHQEMRDQMMAQRGQGNRGQQRDRNSFRDRMHKQLEQILTEEQLQRLEELREERQSERGESQQERQELRSEQHLAFMGAMLKLTDAQEAAINELIDRNQDQIRQIRDQIRDGALERDDARDQMAQIREQTHSAIRDLLTAEQIELFDALAELHPQRARHGRHPF